jgi:hypothetical protein
MGDPVAASPEERVAALTRILDAMDEGDQGRILAWLVLLSAMALIGDAVSGEGLVESFQLGEGKQGRRAFRAWLAEFLLKQPSQPG